MLTILNQMASVGALLDHIVRERAVGNLEDEGIGDLNIRGIEALTLYICFFIMMYVILSFFIETKLCKSTPMR
jgi:hypothetical protein